MNESRLAFLNPEWPEVCCAKCVTLYVPVRDPEAKFQIITGKCPKCGGGKFNTSMRSGGVSSV